MEWLRLYPIVPDYGMWGKAVFENGYGVRVARGPLTQGGPDGLFEAWVIRADGERDDSTALGCLRGNLTEGQALDFIAEIKALR
jgi:hypothetical protein